MFNLKVLEINYLSITIKTKQNPNRFGMCTMRALIINFFFNPYVRSLKFIIHLVVFFLIRKTGNENPKNPNKSDKNM